MREKYALSPEENLAAMLRFASLEPELSTLRLDVFEDMRRMLAREDSCTTCVWNACDPYTMRAVRGVEGNGRRSNCGRTNKDGIDFLKADAPGYERYLALYQTPQEDGGCQGCRFFLMCKGQCPGTAIDGHWRNRTEHCALWKTLYRHFEDQMLDQARLPISASPLRKRIEEAFVACWADGQNTSIASALTRMREHATAVSAPPQPTSKRATTCGVAHGDYPDAHGDGHGRGTA